MVSAVAKPLLRTPQALASAEAGEQPVADNDGLHNPEEFRDRAPSPLFFDIAGARSEQQSSVDGDTPEPSVPDNIEGVGRTPPTPQRFALDSPARCSPVPQDSTCSPDTPEEPRLPESPEDERASVSPERTYDASPSCEELSTRQRQTETRDLPELDTKLDLPMRWLADKDTPESPAEFRPLTARSERSTRRETIIKDLVNMQECNTASPKLSDVGQIEIAASPIAAPSAFDKMREDLIRSRLRKQRFCQRFKIRAMVSAA